MERDFKESVSLEDTLKLQNSMFLETCRVGESGILYAYVENEAKPLKAKVKEIGFLPGSRDMRISVTLELVASDYSPQVIVFDLLTGNMEFFTVQ